MAVSVKIDDISQKKVLHDLRIEEKRTFPMRRRGGPPPEVRKVYLSCRLGEVNLPYSYAKSKGHFPEKRERFKTPTKWSFKLDLRGYQEDIVRNCIENYNNEGSNVLQLFCGFGKTPFSLFLACKVASFYGGLRTLIIVPDNIMIREGWRTCIAESTDAKATVIEKGEIGDDSDSHIILAMKSSVSHIPQKVIDTIGHLVVDEAHLLCTQMSINQILRVKPLFVTLLTATFERKDGFHRAMELIAGTNTKILRVDKKPFHIIKVPTPFYPEGYRVGIRGKDWHDVQRRYEAMPERNKMLVDIIESNRDLKTLVLTCHVDHAKRLSQMVRERGLRCSYLAGSCKSYEDSDVIVATFKKVGEGFDEKNSCKSWNGRRLELLLLAVSKKKIEQDIGRIFRSEKPVMVYPVDDLSNNKNHFRECSRFWKHEGRNGNVITHPWDRELIVKDILKR